MNSDGSYSIQPQPCFFAPLLRETLDHYPVDFDYDGDAFSSNDIRSEFEANDELLKKIRGWRRFPEKRELSEISVLELEFNECPRKGLPDGDTLGSLTSWYMW